MANKTTAQIATDCGLNAEHAAVLAEIIGDHKNGALEEIIGALYRRIEELEEKFVAVPTPEGRPHRMQESYRDSTV